MNILFITHYSEMYGANKSLCRLIVELKQHHQVKPVVLIRHEGPIVQFLEDNSIPYIISHFYWWVYEKNSFGARLHNIIKQLRNLYKLNLIYQKIGNRHIDLVYTNSITINIGFFIARKFKCPHIWHIRESLEQFQFKLVMGGWLAKKFLTKAADRYILISDYLIKSYGKLLPANKTVRIYNGVEIPDRPVQKKNPSDAINFCVLGVVSDQKNQMDAVQAFHILVNQRGKKNIHLHLAGTHKQDYRARIMDYIMANELTSYITCHGHVSDIDHFLNTMDIGLVCSRDEAFGRVSIEFMTHAMPVIASQSGANEELVADGLNGLLYEIHNITELADIIELLLEDPIRIVKMGHAGFEHAVRNFSSQQNAAAVSKQIAAVTK